MSACPQPRFSLGSSHFFSTSPKSLAFYISPLALHAIARGEPSSSHRTQLLSPLFLAVGVSRGESPFEKKEHPRADSPRPTPTPLSRDHISSEAFPPSSLHSPSRPRPGRIRGRERRRSEEDSFRRPRSGGRGGKAAGRRLSSRPIIHFRLFPPPSPPSSPGQWTKVWHLPKANTLLVSKLSCRLSV